MDRIVHPYSDMYNILFLFVFFISLSNSKNERDSNRFCMKTDNTTLECNYIPEDIPDGISRVRIVNVVKHDQDMPCDASSFSTKDNIVEYVEIMNENEEEEDNIDFDKNCFTDLRNLKEIRIHSDRKFRLSEDVFVGLSNVETLDLSRCVRLSKETLFDALNGTNKLPNLKNLILSSTGIYMTPYKIDNTYIDILGRNITYLEMSKMQLSLFNFTAVILNWHNLKALNLSFSNINDLITDGWRKYVVNNLKVLDFSFATFPLYIVPVSGIFKFRNAIATPNRNNAEAINKIFAVETVNITGVFNADTTSVWFYNCTLYTDYYKWSTKHLIVQKNNLKRLGVEFKCNTYPLSSIITFDLSDNGMEYIHPSILYCMVNLQDIRMANNHLFKMTSENLTMFEYMFSLSQNLRHIDLSDNGLTFIPYKIFGQNHHLETVNLSSNRLEQFHSDLEDLKRLRVLDISNNRITVLDKLSINSLSVLVLSDLGNISDLERPTVILISNPLSCSACDSREFVRWLTRTKVINVESQVIKCLNENGKEEVIGKSTLDDVQNICNRKFIIIVTCCSLGLLVLVIAIAIKIILRRRKNTRNNHKRAQLIAKVQHGLGPFEFLAMLSYSAEDKDFAMEYIKTPLNKTFKELFGVDRDLILTGDEHFRPGFMLHHEISLSLERISVVLLLVSENFCSSNYCISELDQACMLKKPIILMFKERVDESLMTPMLRTLYKTTTRVLWTWENGEYKLTTTWKNVCTSILDLTLSRE